MLDLGNSFRASVERDPEALAIVDGDVRLTYAQWYAQHLGGAGRVRRHRADARRPSADAAAEPLGGGDPALGLPIRRHRHHSGQLARQGRRNRLTAWRIPRQRPWCSRRCRRRPCAHRPKPRSRKRIALGAAQGDEIAFDTLLKSRRARRRAARRRRRLVGDALYLRHHRQAERRAAPPARRTRRRGRACGAEPLRARRTHARRHAALSHDGRALAAGDVADRRPLRLPAALRGGKGAGADRGREDQQSLSGADALSRPRAQRTLRRAPTSARCASSALPAPR